MTKIMITGERETNEHAHKLLTDLSCDIVSFSGIKTVLISDSFNERVQKDFCSCNIVVFTSKKSVVLFLKLMSQKLIKKDMFKGKTICAVGEATKKVLENNDIRVDIIPSGRFTGESLAKEIIKYIDVVGKKIFIPQSKIGRNTVKIFLESCGATVVRENIYDVIPVENSRLDVDYILQLIESGELGWMLFFSPSSARNVYNILGKNIFVNKKFKIGCIGPVTSAFFIENGIQVDVIADVFTVEGLIDSIFRR